MKTAKVIATCFNPKEIVEKTRLTGEPLGIFIIVKNLLIQMKL